MPSLFSRARTTSTPTKNSLDVGQTDEFGRVTSRGSSRGLSFPGKKDKADRKKDKGGGVRIRTISTGKGKALPTSPGVDDEEPAIPDGSFLPLSVDPPRRHDDESEADRERHQDYGYLAYQRHVVLGLEEADRLVRAIADELGSRGLTTPFIFSSLAIDVSAAGVRRLVLAFLKTCMPFPAPDADRAWRDEARFAGPHELGMCLRWGLARVVRVYGGHAVRGLVQWDNYAQWSEAEVALNYPPTHFAAFVEPLPPLLCSIVVNVLTLLTRFTAHSASSGHTPPTLSPLFGPLLFGLGPAALSFQHTYVHYLRATNATEHLILAFIRWQDVPSTDSTKTLGSAASLGVPTRLKDWIRGYPSMLPARATKKERMEPRRGARTVRVVSVRRNVRMYSPDLVRTASGWAMRTPQAQGTPGGLIASREWERVAPPTLKLPPRYTDAYKKRMELPPNFHPALPPGAMGSPSTTSSATSSSLSDEHDYFGLGSTAANEERFRSLTDLQWGEFEQMGFGGTDTDQKKLQFDLNESARTARSQKRTTLTWTDFSTSGFSREDAPLNATLQFSTPVANTISAWPAHQVEIARKLKKTEKSLPPFGWDTEPVMGGEEVIEEAFIDVFCDLVYGGGWMDLEREEEVDRECNWALVEYKSLPLAKSTVTPGGSDPRISSIVFLFEEFVPLEYRQQLSASLKPRPRMLSLFSPNKHKQWKQATTLNGRPYVVGHVPKSPSYREVEFERLLRGNASSTKIISFDQAGGVKTATQLQPSTPSTSIDSRSPTLRAPQPSASLYLSPSREPPLQARSPSPSTPTGKKSRFRLPVPLSTTNSRTSGLAPSEYENVDFETRLASYSDEELNSGKGSARGLSKAEKRQSRDDAWVDILVANHTRRMGSQDAELRRSGGRPLKGGISDPELASQEVAQALAAVRGHLPDDDDGDDDDIEPMHVPNGAASQISTTQESSILDETRTETHTDADGEDELLERTTPQKKRLGYFDLHPERRPARSIEEDPRTLLSRKSEDSAELAYNHRAAPSGSMDGDFEPATPSPGLDIPDYRLSSGLRKDDISSKKESMTLPGLMETRSESASPNVSPTTKAALSPPGPGRTAALIEMYREKERQATASRIPIAQKPLPALKQDAPLPAPPAPSPSPPPSTVGEDPETDFMEPARLDFDEGRESPYRYVHGAPLHNVVEEEEEDAAKRHLFPSR